MYTKENNNEGYAFETDQALLEEKSALISSFKQESNQADSKSPTQQESNKMQIEGKERNVWNKSPILQKALVLGVLLLDVLSIGILIPAYPSMVERYHAPDTMITLGLTVYSFFAFFAAPILGQFADKHGRKGILTACVAGTAISFLLLIVTRNIRVYLVARMINGITGGNLSILNAIMNDVSTDHKDRTKNFGLVGAIFGLGFIIGPLLGGLLIGFGLQWVFGITALLSVVELIIMLAFLQETNAHQQKERKVHYNPFAIFRKYLLHGNSRFLFWAILLTGIAGFSFQSILSMILDQNYAVSGQHIGILMAIVGGIVILNNALLLPKFWLKNRTTKKLVYMEKIVSLVIYALMVFFTGYWQLIALWLLAALFGGVGQAVNSAEVVKHSDKTRLGEINGFMGALQSFVMFVGPLIGTAALHWHIPVFYFCAVFFGMALVMTITYFKHEEKIGVTD